MLETVHTTRTRDPLKTTGLNRVYLDQSGIRMMSSELRPEALACSGLKSVAYDHSQGLCLALTHTGAFSLRLHKHRNESPALAERLERLADETAKCLERVGRAPGVASLAAGGQQVAHMNRG
jgi:hypothetical protein